MYFTKDPKSYQDDLVRRTKNLKVSLDTKTMKFYSVIKKCFVFKKK